VLDRALTRRTAGPYQLQAMIAALHARSEAAESTDWVSIAALYEELERATGSPVVALNRAVAVAMAEGYERGLELMDGLPLEGYHLFHSSRADLLRRLERHEEAAAAYRRALELTDSEPERRFLSERLAEVAVA
jgi:RNA polymerase sigma-70 factor (ECF subfamily)